MDEPEILVIEGVNFGPFIEEDGLEWDRGDYFSPNSGRPTMNKKAHMKLVARKPKFRVTCMPMTSADSSRLLAALEQPIVQAKVDSPDAGIITRRFVVMGLNGCLHRVYRNGKRLWGGLSFSLEME